MSKLISSNAPTKLPFSLRMVNRVLLLVIVILALLSGYFHARWQNEQIRTRKLLRNNQLLQDQIEKLELSSGTELEKK